MDGRPGSAGWPSVASRTIILRSFGCLPSLDLKVEGSRNVYANWRANVAPPVSDDGYMSRLAKVAVPVGLLAASAGTASLVVFLAGQGLARAGLWASILSFGLTGVGTAASIWGLVVTRRPRDHKNAPEAMDQTAKGRPQSGAITQGNSGGVNIAHTGSGDINVSGPLP